MSAGVTVNYILKIKDEKIKIGEGFTEPIKVDKNGTGKQQCGISVNITTTIAKARVTSRI